MCRRPDGEPPKKTGIRSDGTCAGGAGIGTPEAGRLLGAGCRPVPAPGAVPPSARGLEIGTGTVSVRAPARAAGVARLGPAKEETPGSRGLGLGQGATGKRTYGQSRGGPRRRGRRRRRRRSARSPFLRRADGSGQPFAFRCDVVPLARSQESSETFPPPTRRAIRTKTHRLRDPPGARNGQVRRPFRMDKTAPLRIRRALSDILIPHVFSRGTLATTRPGVFRGDLRGGWQRRKMGIPEGSQVETTRASRLLLPALLLALWTAVDPILGRAPGLPPRPRTRRSTPSATATRCRSGARGIGAQYIFEEGIDFDRVELPEGPGMPGLITAYVNDRDAASSSRPDGRAHPQRGQARPRGGGQGLARGRGVRPGRDPQPPGSRDWPTYPQLEAELQAVAAAHPELVRLVTIGNTIQGRAIWLMKISDNPGIEEMEPEFKFTSSIHGDEVTGLELCRRMIHHLVDNYGTDPVHHEPASTAPRSGSAPCTTRTALPGARATTRTDSRPESGIPRSRDRPHRHDRRTRAGEPALHELRVRPQLHLLRELPRRRPGHEHPVGLPDHADPGPQHALAVRRGLLHPESPHVEQHARSITGSRWAGSGISSTAGCRTGATSGAARWTSRSRSRARSGRTTAPWTRTGTTTAIPCSGTWNASSTGSRGGSSTPSRRPRSRPRSWRSRSARPSRATRI